MKQIAIVYFSSYGHTKALAKAIEEGINHHPDAVAFLIELTENPNLPNEDKIWQSLNESDAIVFGTPTYMGSVSAAMKKFMDQSSSIWYQQRWKNKWAAGFTHSGHPCGDNGQCMSQICTFACQHSMLWISLGLYSITSNSGDKRLNRLGGSVGLLAQTHDDKSLQINADDQYSAIEFGKRISKVVTAG